MTALLKMAYHISHCEMEHWGNIAMCDTDWYQVHLISHKRYFSNFQDQTTLVGTCEISWNISVNWALVLNFDFCHSVPDPQLLLPLFYPKASLVQAGVGQTFLRVLQNITKFLYIITLIHFHPTILFWNSLQMLRIPLTPVHISQFFLNNNVDQMNATVANPFRRQRLPYTYFLYVVSCAM